MSQNNNQKVRPQTNKCYDRIDNSMAQQEQSIENASTSGIDTRIHLKLFPQPVPGIYVGPQGNALHDFVELHCPDTQNCHLGVLNKTLKHKDKGKELIVIIENKATKGAYLNISDYIELTEHGKSLLLDGKGGLLILKYELRCKGSFHNGADASSGSNCQKYNVNKPDWCSSLGACTAACGFLKLIRPHSGICPRIDMNNLYGKCPAHCEYLKSRKQQCEQRLYHGCGFGVNITATLKQISDGSRQVQVQIVCHTLTIIHKHPPIHQTPVVSLNSHLKF